PVDHRYRPGTVATVIAATVINRVDTVFHRVDLHVVGKVSNGYRDNDVIGHPVDDRYRPGTHTRRIAAAVIGHVDLVGHGIHSDRIGFHPHVDGRGVIGRAIDDGDRTITVICDIGLVG